MNLLLLASALFVCAATFVSNPTEASVSNEETINFKPVQKKAAVNSGSSFVRTNTFKDRVTVKDPIGYFIYDMSVYRADFTDVSYLYLCELAVDFTPGSVATKNESGYDWHYDFWAADVTLGIPNNLSQAKVKDFWPKSSSVQVTLTSSYSTNYTLGVGGGTNLGGGASINASGNAGYTISHSTSTTSEDPSVSAQLLSNNQKTAKWNIQCIVQRGLTYNFACYLLVELPKSYTATFAYSSSIDMTCIAWKGYWWEQKKHVIANNSIASN